MKVLKMGIMLLTSAILFSGCAIIGNSENVEIARTVEAIDGFKRYESEDQTFAMQYPTDWILVDKNTQQSVLETLGEKLNMDSSIFTEELNQYIIMVYAFDEDGYLAHLNIGKTSMDKGIDNKALQDKESQKDYANGLVTPFLVNGTMAEVLQEAQDSDFGGQYFMTAKISFGSGKSKMYAYQAMTIAKENLYSFTFNSTKDKEDSIYADFEKILGSVEFK